MTSKDADYRPSEGEMSLSVAEAYRRDKETVLFAQYARSKTAEEVLTNTCNAFEMVDPQFLKVLGGKNGFHNRLQTTRTFLKNNAPLVQEISYYLSEDDVLKTAVTAHGLSIVEEVIRRKILKGDYDKQVPVHVTNGGVLFLSSEEATYMRDSRTEYKRFGEFNNCLYVRSQGSLPTVPEFSLAVLATARKLPDQVGNTTGVFSHRTVLNGSYFNHLTKTMHIDTSDYPSMSHRDASAKCIVDILHEGRHAVQGNTMLSLVAELDAVATSRDSVGQIEELLGEIPVINGVDTSGVRIALWRERTTGIEMDLQDKLSYLTLPDIRSKINADHNIQNKKMRNTMLLRV